MMYVLITMVIVLPTMTQGCRGSCSSKKQCEVSSWEAWSPCNASCGEQGNRTRARSITNRGEVCPYDLKQVQACIRECGQFCHNGECVTTGTSRGQGCRCKLGFYGKCCDKVHCKSFRCHNGGTCSENPHSLGYPCSCPLGFLGLECKAFAPARRIPREFESEETVEVTFKDLDKKEWTSNRDMLFKNLVANATLIYCKSKPSECCKRKLGRNGAGSYLRNVTLDVSQVHLIPNFPVNNNQNLVVAFYVLYPKDNYYLQSNCGSGSLPKEAVQKAIAAQKHYMFTRFSYSVSEVKAIYKATTTTTTTVPTTTTTTASTVTPTTSPGSNGEILYPALFGALGGVIAIVVGIVVVAIGVRRDKKKKAATTHPTSKPDCTEPTAPSSCQMPSDPPPPYGIAYLPSYESAASGVDKLGQENNDEIPNKKE